MEARHDEEIADLKTTFRELADELLLACNEQNVDGMRTAAGTVSRRVSSRYWTSDWESMYKFIKEKDVPYLLEQRLHNGNMKQFLQENPDEMPPGLQADNKFVIQVRKPTAK
jgi:hypothetical protein